MLAVRRESGWLRPALIILALEKVVQHSFVTAAFLLDLGGIRGQVAVSADVLMAVGAIVGLLYAVATWALLVRRSWAANLLIGLAAFDIVGEFVAQGRPDIVCTVSFVVAWFMLGLALVYRKQCRLQSQN
jgi:uncharacterized membrane protein (UPF0136 family)